uniref:non-specific serine/threonine protein kinase n=1 Tax=Culicoides sonorensis TaxID=179676 RepID=A0A336M472_CULSO
MTTTRKRQKYYVRITYAVFTMLKNNAISVTTNVRGGGDGSTTAGIKLVCSNVLSALLDRMRQLTITPRMPASRLLLGPTTHLQFLSPNITPQLTPLFVKKKSEPRASLTILDDVYPASSESSLYGSDEEQEDAAQYCRGGYHPIVIGDVFDNRYRVVRKLGWGHFSTVWLCCDLETEKYIALKVVKSAPHYTETAIDEIRLLEKIRDADMHDPNRARIVRMLNHFTVRGVNGVHTCLVFEALGCSLYKLIVKNNYQGLAIQQVKSIIKQVLQGLEYLHTKCHIIHTDIKPENILLVMDNAATMNQEIDDEIMSLKDMGVEFPDSYISAYEKSSKETKKSDTSYVSKRTSLEFQSSTSEEDSGGGGGGNADKTTPGDKISTAATSLLTAVQKRSFELTGSNDETTMSDNEVVGAASFGRFRIERRNSKQHNGKFILSEGVTTPTTELNSNTGGNNKKFLQTQISQKSMSSPLSHSAYQSAIQNLINNHNVQVKIADLGNACFENHHFTEDIQTRQYRALEVLLGSPYSYSADIWSTACLAFELATGDYLFDPHSGDSYTRDEDHLAHIIELLGNIPPSLIFRGKHGKKYFTSYGSLRNITKLKPWKLYDVLTEKYEWDPEEAKGFTDFLLPMLDYNPLLRSTAAKSVQHPWLDTVNISTQSHHHQNKRTSSSNIENNSVVVDKLV